MREALSQLFKRGAAAFMAVLELWVFKIVNKNNKSNLRLEKQMRSNMLV